MVDHIINDILVNGKNFKSYLRDLKNKYLDFWITEPIFIMDYVAVHHNSGLDDVINDLNTTILYLQPFSSFLNIIENCLSKLKILLNDQIRLIYKSFS